MNILSIYNLKTLVSEENKLTIGNNMIYVFLLYECSCSY